MGELLKAVEATAREAAQATRRCGFQKAMETLNAEDRKDVVTGLQKYPTSAVGRVLRQHGCDVSDETIRRHQRGNCSCEE